MSETRTDTAATATDRGETDGYGKHRGGAALTEASSTEAHGRHRRLEQRGPSGQS
ncbi:hypothetical protein [Streptomyces sp. NPDC050738]|uniref:hypothetical protein n=1 Tax=Streptomyces sp. NPDC050738 TaxID=3154744 RepID=UPI0034250DC6